MTKQDSKNNIKHYPDGTRGQASDPGQGIVEERLSYHFKDSSLLRRALTHTSYANEMGMDFEESNEKLEFLGDAILNMITSIILIERFPYFDEGELSRFRSRVVGEASLAGIGRLLGLTNALLLGKGEEQSGGREKKSIVASTFEAVVAALYMDACQTGRQAGFEKTFETLSTLLRDTIEEIRTKASYLDYKTLLQELSQKIFKKIPTYRLIKEEGPEHLKLFEIDVTINGKVYGHGRGKSKKEAEKEAAKMAYKRLKEL